MVKFGLLDPDLMRQMRERLFAGAAEFGGRIRADDPDSWVGPLREEEESGSGMHGLLLNSRAGTIWKERMAGGEELMLDMLPRHLNGIAEQLLGKGEVLEADGTSVGQMLGVPDDENFVDELRKAGQDDVGATAMCARWLHKLATEDWPVKKPPEANLHDMFVVSTRSRGIYVRFRPSLLPPLPAAPAPPCQHSRGAEARTLPRVQATLPSPPDHERHPPGPGRGGHNDSHPFQLGVEAYIDDVPPNGGGFMIWPRAHSRLFHLCTALSSAARTPPTEPGLSWRVSRSQTSGSTRASRSTCSRRTARGAWARRAP